MDQLTYRPGEVWQLPDNDGQPVIALTSLDNPDITFTFEWVEGNMLFGDTETMGAFLAYQSYFSFKYTNGHVGMYIQRQIYDVKGQATLKGLIKEFVPGQVLFAALCNRIEDRESMRHFNAIDLEDLVDLVAPLLVDEDKHRLREAAYQQARDQAMAAVDARFPNRGGHE